MTNEYKIIDDNHAELIIIGTKNEGIVLIDTEDIPKLQQRSWYIKDGSPNNYVACKMNNKTIKMHRFLMGVTEKSEIVDHFDRNTLNNRKKNLRVTDSSTNNLNTSMSKNNVRGRTGVFYNKGVGTRSDKWVAQYQVNGKKKSKSFSIEKYGHDEAFKMAVEFREKVEEEYGILTERTSK